MNWHPVIGPFSLEYENEFYRVSETEDCLVIMHVLSGDEIESKITEEGIEGILSEKPFKSGLEYQAQIEYAIRVGKLLIKEGLIDSNFLSRRSGSM